MATLPHNKTAGRKASSETGSAIVYVFIGILLFALLAFAFSRGMSSSSNSAGTSSAKPKAIEIMNYGEALARGVDMLLAKGCSINELNFKTTRYTHAAGSVNPNAPTDESCDVFSQKGGKITWRNCPDPDLCSDPYLYDPSFPPNLIVRGVGDKPEDLVFTVLVRKDVCMEINKMLKLPTVDLPATTIYNGMYTGTFTPDSNLPGINSGNFTAFENTTAGCMYAGNYMTSWGGEYFVYYKVLQPI